MAWYTHLILAAGVATQLVAPSLGRTLNTGNSSTAPPAATTYSHDGRTCCPGGDEGTAFIDGQCKYGAAVLTPALGPGDHVTKCCWNTTASDFHVHYENDADKPTTQDVDVKGGGNYPNSFCNLGLSWHIDQYTLDRDGIWLHIALNVDCGPYNKTDIEWIWIAFNSAWTGAGTFTYGISGIGPTIHVELQTRIKRDDLSVDVWGHVTGTGIISALDETFNKNIADSSVKALLALEEIC
ncbi:hypothetical protein HIM_04640 [Hirsutella minnesotensis 3608]|uniref:Uncharacterized protein n=1 Tax=Hirsutella minnesotensis 3608 TaxID=1043627 RepID=A0A0F7ZKZ7_9HYPO|nr:hypothetical protein HIM_04640 [Hirsutella minnesotensis 3608]